MSIHRRNFAPSTVTTPLMIECNDVQIDANGTYDATSGCLESVIINGRHVSIAQIDAALAILCPGDMGAWSDDLDGDTLNVLINEAGEDAEADWADWMRDLRAAE
jgi:hypothetical protein